MPYFFEDPSREDTIAAAVEARDRQWAVLRASITPDMARQADFNASIYPDLPASAVVASGVLGLSAEELTELARRNADERASIAQRVANAGQAGVRGAFLVFDALYEEAITRPFRTAVGAFQEAGPGALTDIDLWDRQNVWRQNYNLAGESALVSALRARTRGEPVNIGSGIIPQSTLPQDRPEFRALVESGVDPAEAEREINRAFGLPITQIADEQQRRIQYRGQPVSFGRVAAAQVFEPGSTPYNLFSGALDASQAIFVDPAHGGVAAASRAARLSRTFRGGLLGNGPRKTIFGRTVRGFVEGEDGIRLSEFIAGQQDSDAFVNIYQLLSDSGRLTLPARMIDQMVDATDTAAVQAILLENLGLGAFREAPRMARRLPSRAIGRLFGGEIGEIGGIRRGLGRAVGGIRVNDRVVDGVRFERTLDELPIARLFNRLPGGQITAERIDDAVVDFDLFMRNAGFDRAARSGYLRRIAQLENGDSPGLFAVVREAGEEYRNRLIERGLPAPAARRIDDFFRSFDEMRAYFGDALGNPMYFVGSEVMQANGEFRVGNTAHLLSEYLKKAITLPDSHEMRKAESTLVKLFRDPAVGKALDDWAVERVMDFYMQKFWKPAVLLRVAWPVRVIGEEQLRMAATGLDNVFSHPLSYLSWMIGRSTDQQGRVSRFLAKFLPERGATGVLRESDIGRTQRLLRQRAREAGEIVDDEAFLDSLALPGRPGSGLAVRQADDLDTGVAGAADDIGERAADAAARPDDFTYLDVARDHQEAMSRVVQGFLGRHGRNPNGHKWRWYSRNEPGWAQARATEINQLVHDEVSQAVAQAILDGDTTLATVKQRFMDGDLAWARHQLVRSGGDAKRDAFGDPARLLEPTDPEALRRRVGADLYVDSVAARIHIKTGGNVELIDSSGRAIPSGAALGQEGGVGVKTVLRDPVTGEPQSVAVTAYRTLEPGDDRIIRAIATGELERADQAPLILRATGMTNRKWKRLVRTLNDEYALPEGVETRFKGPALTFKDGKARIDAGYIDGMGRTDYDRVIDDMFGFLMGRPTDRLSRSVAFRQAYWQRMEEVVPFLTPGAQRQVLDAADAANLTSKARRRLRRAAERASGDLDDFEAIDAMGKAYGLSRTRELLYDLSRRHQITEIFRAFVPFGEAWGEILTTWFGTRNGILWKHPEIVRRGQQFVEGARGAGFFTTDETTGEEIFNYPFGGIVSNLLFDDPDMSLRFTGSVRGANLFTTNYLPGFGPVVQIPTSSLIPDTPRWDTVRDLVLPFGPEKIDSPGDIINVAVPAWMEKVLVAVNSQDGDFSRLHNNTVIDVMRTELLGGGYDTANFVDRQRLLRRSSRNAGYLTMIRAVTQMFSPTGPQIRFERRDKDGKWWLFQTLAGEYYRLQQEHDFDDAAAFDAFVGRFGIDPISLATPKTRTVQRRGTTAPAVRFERANRDLFRQFPNSAYFAQPDNPDDPFDYEAYLRQLRNQTRFSLQPGQWLLVANDLRGRLMYERERRRVEAEEMPTDASRAYLRAYRLWLMDEYHGYQRADVGIPERAPRDIVIAEFEAWRGNERLMATDAGQGLALYLAARDQAKEAAAAAGLAPDSFATAERMRWAQDWLRAHAEWVISQHREFGPMWAAVFSRELVEEEVAEPTAIPPVP